MSDEPKAVSVPSVRQCQTKHHARFSIFHPSIIEDVVIPETPSDGAVKSQQKEEKDVSPQVKGKIIKSWELLEIELNVFGFIYLFCSV